MAASKVEAAVLVGFLVLMGITTLSEGTLSKSLFKRIGRINKEGPFLGVVVPNAFEMNPLLESSSFVADERFPYLDFAGVIIMSDKGKSKETDDIDRAHWSDSMRKCLIDICLEQVKAGGRPGVQFSSKAWKMIIEKFTQRTGHSFNQKQLKNQLDHLKKLYNVWLHLTSQTGIGFNPHTGCVEMAQDRWTEYLKTHKDAKVFKSKPLPFPQEMAALFDGTLATGDDKWAPTMDGVPEDIIMDMDSSFHSLNGFGDTPSPNQTNPQSTMREDATTSDIGTDVMMANIRRKRPRPSTKGSNTVVDDCIIELAASVKASNQLAAAPPGKYYLVDAGYTNMRGFLSPFRNVRYWLPDFQGVAIPRTREEHFNRLHSSLRNVIERSFGVLKARFPILKRMAPYPFPVQRSIVVATMAMHNFIRKEDMEDRLFSQFSDDDAQVERDTDIEESHGENAYTFDITDRTEMDAKRNSIADAIWRDASSDV